MNKIIDFHTHPFLSLNTNICYFKNSIKMEDVDGIKPALNKMGIEMICGSVLIVNDPNNPMSMLEKMKKSNDLALELRERLGDFYYPGFHIHPDYPKESLAEMERFAEKGFRLVGELVPHSYGWSEYTSKEYSYLLDACAEHDFVVSMHSLFDYDGMDRVVSEHKNVKMVMAHPNEPDIYERHLRRMDISDNYYLDLSGTGLYRNGMLAYGISRYGADKFLFGSDYPVCNPGMFVGGVVLDPLLSEEDKQKVLYDNAKRLLGI